MASKKSFKDTAAPTRKKDKEQSAVMSFITTTEPAAEKQTAHINLLVTPTLKDDLLLLARMNGSSLNSMINTIVSDYVAERKTNIDQYRKIVEGMKV